MKKIILLLLLALTANAQDRVSLSIHQDAKLLIVGDTDRGYEAGTLNFLARFKMQGKQKKDYGYMIVYPEFELANIEGHYKRYSVNVGYTFNKLILDNLEASLSGGWGFITRYDNLFFSGSINGELAYRLSDKFKVSMVAQFTDRKDLKYMYGTNVIRFSGFIGVEFNIN